MDAALVVFAVLTGLVLLLIAPVDVAFRLEGVEAFSGQISIGWLFGLARFRIQVPSARKLPRPETALEAAKARGKSEKRTRRANVLAVLRQAAFRRRVYRLVKDLLGGVRLRQLRLRMRLGLGDPADTGRLWAFVGPINAVAGSLRNAEVHIEPEFVDPVFEFQADGRLLLIPLQLLVLAIGFALSPASIRAWRTLKGTHA